FDAHYRYPVRAPCHHAQSLAVICTLSLHDALPISERLGRAPVRAGYAVITGGGPGVMEAANRGALEAGGRSVGLGIDPPPQGRLDRKSTRLNSSHVKISYAVFCLEKKKKKKYRRGL